MVWFGVFDCTHRQVGLSLLTCKLQVAGFGKSGLCSQGSSPLDSPSLVISLSPYYLLLFFISFFFFFNNLIFHFYLSLSFPLFLSLEEGQPVERRMGWVHSVNSFIFFAKLQIANLWWSSNGIIPFHVWSMLCLES